MKPRFHNEVESNSTMTYLFCHREAMKVMTLVRALGIPNSAEVEIDSLTVFNVPLFIFLDRKYS